MQAVASVLGVDRKAVNHYVSDRETLRRLVAVEAFSRSFSAVTIPAECDWREASRIYGHGIAAAVTALGPLAGQVRVGASADALLLAVTETVLAKFVEGALDLEMSVRAVSLLAEISDAHGRGVALMAAKGAGRRHRWLQEVLDERPEARPHYLGELAESQLNTYDARQLDLSIEIFILGVEALAGGAAVR